MRTQKIVFCVCGFGFGFETLKKLEMVFVLGLKITFNVFTSKLKTNFF